MKRDKTNKEIFSPLILEYLEIITAGGSNKLFGYRNYYR